MEAPATQFTFREILSHGPIRRLWVAQLISVFGDFLALFAVYSIVSFRLHGTPLQVSLILVSYMLPLAFMGPLAGVFVDRWNVKKAMIGSDLIRAVLVLWLIFSPGLYQIYFIFFALSAVSSFFLPAQSITIRTIAPKEGLMAANALMSQAFHVMQIVSPAVAAFLVTYFGEKSCFYLDSLSFVFSALILTTLVIPGESSPVSSDVRGILADLTTGIKFIFTHATVSFVILSLAAGVFAIRCFSALIAVYVRDILMRDAALFGTISSLVGVGVIIGTQMVNKFARRRAKGNVVIAGLIGNGISIFLLAAFGNVPVTLLSSWALGFSVALILIPAQTVIQTETPASMLGRVSSSMMSVLSFAQLAGLTLAGSIAGLIGIKNLYYASAAFLFLIAFFGHWRLRKQGP